MFWPYFPKALSGRIDLGTWSVLNRKPTSVHYPLRTKYHWCPRLLKESHPVTILEHATKFFSTLSAPRFENDVGFLTALYEKVPTLVYTGKTPDEMRQERRARLDAESHADAPIEIDEQQNGVLNLMAQLRAALRTLEVMGQIVKNFAGSMKNEPRYKLVKECYELGLRVVGVLLDRWKQTGDQLVREVLDLVLEKETQVETREELEKLVKSLIFFFCETVAKDLIKKIAHAVGTKDLADTYRRVLEDHPTNAYALIDLAVKLDSVGFPTGEVYELNHRFHGKIFCHRVLCRLVLDHFYLFATSDRTKQQVCNKLGIKIEDLRGIDAQSASQKRLPGREGAPPPFEKSDLTE